MISECSGLVLRRTQALKGRSMLLLLTDHYGKISAGTSISERGKSGSALAVRRFTLGRYQITESRGNKNISSAETVKNYYALSEDYEKFLAASMVLEFTEKILPEDIPVPDLYQLVIDYLTLLLVRSEDFDTLTASWLMKALQNLGVLPDAENFQHDELLSSLDFVTMNAIAYILDNPLNAMRNLTLPTEKSMRFLRLILRYAAVQFDIGTLKSDLPKEV
ncbi:MAG: DNA repair protein RecO [Clostridiales Family XIII bacterium]|jgi:DNA repair protein RecO (recombination protein O)|nr:DNA repair protein RecO [Clostridiales Family XIII bacterium]